MGNDDFFGVSEMWCGVALMLDVAHQTQRRYGVDDFKKYVPKSRSSV